MRIKRNTNGNMPILIVMLIVAVITHTSDYVAISREFAQRTWAIFYMTAQGGEGVEIINDFDKIPSRLDSLFGKNSIRQEVGMEIWHAIDLGCITGEIS